VCSEGVDMPDAEGFLGEIEFVEGLLPSQEFGRFEHLPGVQAIHELAHEFSQCLELMPYQKVGEPPKLLVSVYVASRFTTGRMIAVLVRDEYPSTWEALAEKVKLALLRLDALDRMTEQIEAGSIAQARAALDGLSQKICRL
jgi:hypothetical protein